MDKIRDQLEIDEALRGKTVDVIAISDFTDIYYRTEWTFREGEKKDTKAQQHVTADTSENNKEE